MKVANSLWKIVIALTTKNTLQNYMFVITKTDVITFMRNVDSGNGWDNCLDVRRRLACSKLLNINCQFLECTTSKKMFNLSNIIWPLVIAADKLFDNMAKAVGDIFDGNKKAT